MRPVKFVRATLTPFLFQHSEEVLKSAADIAGERFLLMQFIDTTARWLIDRVSWLDTTETSHVPTADRVARLFHQSDAGASTTSESDSDSEDALEEIDFADLAQIRAEVDAIARGAAAATADRDAHADEEDIEEVDFADLAALRAKVDAAEPRAVSRNGIVQEAFTGMYNQVGNTTTTDVVDGGQPNCAQQTASSSASRTLDDALNLKPISNLSDHKSCIHHRGTIRAQEEAHRSSNALPNMPVKDPSPSTAPETHHVTAPADDIHFYPDTLSHDDPHPLFVVDTAPTRPFAHRSASDLILVNRTGHGETLGDQDDELIVYVAPHPRIRGASPVPAVPRVKLPKTSVLTGRSFEVGGLTSPVREDGEGSTVPDRDRGRTRTGLEGEAGEEHQLSLASLTFGVTALTTTTSTSTSPPARPPRTKADKKAEKKARKKEARLQRHRERHDKRGGLGFGVSEAKLREEDAREKRHPRWETRRRGDSDVDWGTEDEDKDQVKSQGGEDDDDDGVDAVSDGLGGMQIDPDLEIDVDAMQGFVKSMSAEGSRFVTMDDLEDEARMREDEEGQGGPDGSSASGRSDDEEPEVEEDEEEEGEEVFDIEERILIAESEGDEELSEDSDDDDDDDELSPRSSFQARLRKLREQSRGRRPKNAQETSDDEEEEDTPEFPPWTRSAEDEEFIAHIHVSRALTCQGRPSHAEIGIGQDLIEENSQVLSGRNRKQKKAVFRNLHEGYVDERDVEAFMDDPEFTTPVNKKSTSLVSSHTSHRTLTTLDWAEAKKGKGKGKQPTEYEYVDPKMAAQWARDRAKKAERKRERETARLLAALDPLSADPGHGHARASRKAMRAAARLDPSTALALAPRAIVGADVDALEAQMRRFVERSDRPRMALPPMDKPMRKRAHELAAAFGVGSTSKGQGGARYVTLTRLKTRRGVNEGKVRALVKRGRGKGAGMPRHREGDEVGKEAPKIGESNIGFRMLASMGWSEGVGIGGTASVGIETPLTAIIKNSKLGLGATR